MLLYEYYISLFESKYILIYSTYICASYLCKVVLFL